MRKQDYIERFKNECNVQTELTSNKGSDYSGEDNVFKNFEAVERLGVCSVEVGILTRMSDKFSRICNLVKMDRQQQSFVKDETIIDTLRDLSIYSKILMLYLEEKRGMQPLVSTSEQPIEAVYPLEKEAEVPLSTDKATLGQTSDKIASRGVEPFWRPSQREGKRDRTEKDWRSE